MSDYQHPVRVGQTWRSKDKRDNGRTVVVRTIDFSPSGFADVASETRAYAIRIRTLRTRYELITEAAR